MLRASAGLCVQAWVARKGLAVWASQQACSCIRERDE